MFRRDAYVACGVAVLMLGGLPAAAQDNVEAPWGCVNGNIFGTARSDAIPVLFDASTGAQEAWRFDPATANTGRIAPSQGAMVFDAKGNIYYRAWQQNKLTSVAPNGTHRWNANDGAGNDIILGGNWVSSSPVVGQQRVYILGAVGNPTAYAFNKNDGGLIWFQDLTTDFNGRPTGEPSWSTNNQPAPTLYDGKLYVVGETDGVDTRLYQLDAATGAMDWHISFFQPQTFHGGLTLVPDAFGAGEHGLYFNLDGNQSFSGVYGLRIDTNLNTATVAWEAAGGKVARSHVIYNLVANHLYTHTWTNYGASLYVFDPVSGFLYDNGANQPAGGHGFYDVGLLDWDDATVIAGGFDGRLGLYEDTGGAVNPDVIHYKTWFGEFRIFGQLLKNGAGESILVTGTNSRVNDLGPEFTARVIVANLNQAMRGPIDDGPMYLDDIQIFEDGNLIYSEDFESYPAGTLAGNGGWVHDNRDPSGNNTTNPVLVGPGPVNPANQVAAYDAAGSGGGWQGVFQDLTDTTGDVARIVMRVWRADLTDNVWIYFGDFPGDFNDLNGWCIAWDITQKLHAWKFENPGGTSALAMTAGVWQTWEIEYDFANFEGRVTIDGVTGDPVTLNDGFAAFFWAGFGMRMEGTAVSSGFNTADVEYDTGVESDHGFTLRGGPVAGPDGKIYYFDTNTSELVALEPGGSCAGFLCGDANCDTLFNGGDIDPFFLALGDPVAWEAQFPNCDLLCVADINHDQSVNGADIDAFFLALGQGGCP